MKQGSALKVDWQTFIASGDSTCFYDLYAHYHDYLTYIGLKRGTSAEKTKDCINDLFLYVYENRENLSHIQNHHNYLITSFLRKLFRKQHFSAEESIDLLSLENPPTYPSVEADYINEHTNTTLTLMLKKYVDKLSASQARMIYQKFYLGLSYEEISENNQITVKTAYNTIYNAVEKLKKMIDEDHLGALSIGISMLILMFFIFFLKSMGKIEFSCSIVQSLTI